jgi:Cof subfamily protein (haloacid dehalogenase superfamily)
MTSRVIALDLDGTLLTPQKTLLPSSLEALNRAREEGYQLLIVTGRHHVAIHPFYQALALDTPAICCNGTYLYDYHAKKVLKSDPLPVAQAQQLITLLDEHDVHGLMYVDDAMLYERPTGHVIRTSNWAQSLPEAQRPVFTQVPSLAQAAQEVSAIWKFALIEPLRAMRFVYYLAWLIRRWDDPAFPRNFPWLTGEDYWRNQISTFIEQVKVLQEPPLQLTPMY